MEPDRALVPLSENRIVIPSSPPLARIVPVAATLVALSWGAGRLIWRWRNRRRSKQLIDTAPTQRILIYRYRLRISVRRQVDL
jgi:hypothetical protein